jgi:hypothetical protein
MAPLYQYIVNIDDHNQYFMHEETRVIFGWAKTEFD